MINDAVLHKKPPQENDMRKLCLIADTGSNKVHITISYTFPKILNKLIEFTLFQINS